MLLGRKKILCWDSSKLPSQTGCVIGSSRQASAPEDHPGFLTYGPYISLPPAKYIVIFKYTAEASDSAPVGFLDIGVFQGKSVSYGKIPLAVSTSKEVRLNFEVVDNAVEKLEIRVFFEGRGRLTAHKLTVKEEKRSGIVSVAKELFETCRQLFNKLEVIEQHLAELKDGQKALFYNQVSLANSKPGKVPLFTPWCSSENSQVLSLIRLESGQLCFQCTKNEQTRSGPVFISTIPKSGTWFVLGIVKILGFQSSQIVTNDSTGLDKNKTDIFKDGFRDDRPIHSGIHNEMPYELQTSLILPGQILHGHTHAAPFLRTHLNNPFILSVRDLRFILLSWLRYFAMINDPEKYKTIPSANSFSPNDLIHCINKYSVDAPFTLKACVKDAITLKTHNMCCLVRFEELNALQIEQMRPSAEAIAVATGKSVEDVYEAIRKVRGQPTSTFSGELSKVDKIWTPEVEVAFIQAGWHLLNEQLGYPRDYDPDYYKNA